MDYFDLLNFSIAPIVLGGLLGGLGSLISGLVGGGLGYDAQKKSNDANLQIARETNEANFKLAQYQWDKNLEMWNMQNEYNSPSAQMQRFQAAGLNPNLIYGKGNSGNSSTLPQYSAPRMQSVTMQPEFFDMGNALSFLSQYQDWRIKSAQEENIRQDTENKRVQSEDLWKALINLYSSNSGLSVARANEINSLLPYRQRDYNLRFNTSLFDRNLALQKFIFDKDLKHSYLKLSNDKFNYFKDYNERSLANRFVNDSLNRRIGQIYGKKLYQDLVIRANDRNFVQRYGVLPNTEMGNNIILWNKALPGKNPYSLILGERIGFKLLNNVSNIIDSFSGFFRPKKFKNKGYSGWNPTYSY